MTLQIGRKENQNKSAMSRRGFTLIELVLVILVLSIIAGLSTPLFRRTFLDLQLKNTSFDIAKLINYAQEMAIIDKVNYKTNFDFEKGRVWLTKQDLTQEGAPYIKIQTKYGRTYVIGQGIFLAGENEALILYPDGQCEEGEIKIIDKNGTGYILRVKGFGTQVDIEETGNG